MQPESKLRRYVEDIACKIGAIELVQCDGIEVIAHDESKLWKILQGTAAKASGFHIWITLGRGASQSDQGRYASGPLLNPQRFLVEIWSNPATSSSVDPLHLSEAIMETLNGAITPDSSEHDDQQADDCRNIYDVIGWDVLPPDQTTTFFRYQINIDARTPLAGTN